MLFVCLLMVFLSASSFVIGLMPIKSESRPKLQLQSLGLDTGTQSSSKKSKFKLFRKLAFFNRAIGSKILRSRIEKDLRVAHVDMSVNEFFLLKEIAIALLLIISYPYIGADMIVFWICIGVAVGYMLPEFWIKGKIKKVKDQIVRDLPDAVDLLGLCVNAGLDFMMALKWVVEKSPASVIMSEMNNMLQEISVGKPRRDALRDLSKKYELTDLSTFSRTLIQADKMGTSVSEALNILSEDMRLARFRRGEAIALKAPLKMLAPLLFFIFPVVTVLVGGPIFLDFIQNNPIKNLSSNK